MAPDSALARYVGELAREPFELERAALAFGLFDHEIELDAYLSKLDQLAERAAGAAEDPVEQIASLFGADGLKGNADAYDDPRNSYLDAVLDRRLGLPISLSVIAMAVGRRLGIQVDGVPFPGHFLIRVRSDEGGFVLDPFSGGGEVSDGELLLRHRAIAGRITALGPEQLGAAQPHAILARMLQNLKVTYLQSEDYQRGLAIQERLLVTRPDVPSERRDRGLLYARLERHVEAEADLTIYLEQTPGAADAATVREVLTHVRTKRGPGN